MVARFCLAELAGALASRESSEPPAVVGKGDAVCATLRAKGQWSWADYESGSGCCWRARWGAGASNSAYREDDVERYLQLFNIGASDGGWDGGLELVTEGVLLSPAFLFKWYPGEPSSTTTARLTSFELASRLSYFVTGGPPDQNLLAAADNDDLLSDANLESETRRLLELPPSQRQVQHFYDQWLGLYQLDNLAGPELSAELLKSVRAQTRRLGCDFDLGELIVHIALSQPFRNRDRYVGGRSDAVPPAPMLAAMPVGKAAPRKVLLDFVVGEMQWFASVVSREDRSLVEQYLTGLRTQQVKLGNIP